MATPLLLGDTWQAVVACYMGGQVSENRYLFNIGAIGGAGATDVQLATALDTLLAPLYKAIIANTATYYGVKLFRRKPVATTASAIVTANTGVGTGGADSLPSAVCGLMRSKSNAWGRKGIGRTFLPFVSETFSNTLGEPTGGYAVLTQALGAALIGISSVGAGGNTAQVFWSLPGTLVAPVNNFVLSTSAPGKFGTQHRRGDYGRLNPIPPF